MSDETLIKEGQSTQDPNLEHLSEEVLDKMEKGMPTFVVRQGGLWELWATATELSQYRLNRYRDYDDMATDSLIASALELVTDDACQFSADRGATIWPAKGADEKWVKQALATLQIEENIWGMVHNTALYGDLFPQFIVEEGGKSKGKSGYSFKSLDISIHPSEVRRLDIDGKLAGFLTQEEFSKVKTHHPWEFVHFMLNNRPRFERHKLRVKGSGSDYTRTDYTPQQEGKKGKEVIATSMYGTSWLDPSRHVYRVLKLLEQSLALARLNRSPLIRVFYVNTTGMTPKERKDSLDNLHKRFKKNLSMDMRQNFYKSDYNPLSYNADLFIPVTDGVGQITAETLGGELNIKDIVDVDYQKNKLFAALRIPQAYLGFEETMPGTIGSTTLVRMDIRYARSVKKIQRSTISGVTRLLEVLYALERGERPDPKKIAIEMEVISGIEELDRTQALEQKLGVASQFIQLVNDLEGKINSKPLLTYVFDTVLGLKDISPELEIQKNEPGNSEGPTEEGEEGDLFDTASLTQAIIHSLQGEGDPDPSVIASLIEATRRQSYLVGAAKISRPAFEKISSETKTETYDLLEDLASEPDTRAELRDLSEEEMVDEVVKEE